MHRIVLFALCIAVVSGACSNSSTKDSTDEAELISIDGKELTKIVSDKRADGSKALLINVWATWCGPCVEEFPIITELAEKHKEDLEVMFVSGDFPTDTLRVKSFLEEHGVYYDTYLKAGSEFTFIESLHPEWTGALPFTVIYNKDGEEVGYWENKADSVIFDSYINKAIKQ